MTPMVAILATEGFSPFHISVPLILFGNILPDHKLFDLHICAERPGPLSTSPGLVLHAANGLEIMEKADIIIIPYWQNAKERPSPSVLHALQNAYARGAHIVGLCLGAYVLAYAGLLDGKSAATHWEYEEDFTRRFPQVRLNTNVLYVDDAGLISSAGTAAGLDCCLYIIRKYYGSIIANKAARRMIIPPHREGGQAQFIDRPLLLSTQDSRINALLESLQNDLDQQHNLDTLAASVAMSRRTFTRHFHQATGMSLKAWLTTRRLQKSMELLEATTHSIDEIASLSGFCTPLSFRKHFKQKYGVSPSCWRKSFQDMPVQA